MASKLPVIQIVSGILFLTSVTLFGNSNEANVVVVDPSWHGSAPQAISLEDPGELLKRNTEVFELVELCRSTGDLPTRPHESCIQRLDEYFSEVPIWRSTVILLFVGTRGSGHYSSFDTRAHYMGYEELEYVQRDVPRWKDIFDGHEESRLDIVSAIFGDGACLSLTELGRIQPSYAKRCEVRELFKYANYLDACMTGFKRGELFHASWGNPPRTTYERARKSMDPTVVVDYRNGNG